MLPKYVMTDDATVLLTKLYTTSPRAGQAVEAVEVVDSFRTNALKQCKEALSRFPQ